MFTHPQFNRIQPTKIPLNQDLVIMDAKWMSEYEREWIKIFEKGQGDPYSVGYVSHVAARSIGATWLELSWYPNIYDRFHEVPIFLPISAVNTCVDVDDYDEHLHIFVESEWLIELHERPLAAFGIVDAAGIKTLLKSGALRAETLRALRGRVDTIAERNPNFAFISFADSLLVKQVWSMGHIEREVKYTYSPEALLPVVAEIAEAFETTLGIPAYAILTQGVNAYADDTALHLSPSRNHVSLNTLGLPFAQLVAIEAAARNAIRNGVHAPAQLYLDSTFFRSLKLKNTFKKDLLRPHAYTSPMTKSQSTTYVATSLDIIIDNIRPQSA